MPTFLLFQIASVLLALISIRVLATTVRRRHAVFDDRVTAADRQQLAELAFFVLVPLGVLLHELGHVVSVRLAGGQVVGFGFLFFLGWVEHTGQYSPVAGYWIALSGNLVSIGLGLAALVLALRGPFGRAVNWLLVVFAGLELGTSLVFYPLLDLVSDLYGDWSVVYRESPVRYAVVTGIVHASFLATGIVCWRSDRFRQEVERRTGVHWSRRMSGRQRRELARALVEAAEQLASARGHPMSVVAGIGPEHAGVALRWESGGLQRHLAALFVAERGVYDVRAELEDAERPGARVRIRLGFLDRPLPVDELRQWLEQAVEAVDRWPVSPAIGPAAGGDR